MFSSFSVTEMSLNYRPLLDVHGFGYWFMIQMVENILPHLLLEFFFSSTIIPH